MTPNILIETISHIINENAQIAEGNLYDSIYALVKKIFEKAVELKQISSIDPRLVAVCEEDEEHGWIADLVVNDGDSHMLMSELIAASPNELYNEMRYYGTFHENLRCIDESSNPHEDIFIVNCMPTEKYIRHRAEEIEKIDVNLLSTERLNLTMFKNKKYIFQTFIQELIDNEQFYYKFNDPEYTKTVKKFYREVVENIIDITANELNSIFWKLINWLSEFADVEDYLEIKKTKTDNDMFKIKKMPPELFFIDLISHNYR